MADRFAGSAPLPVLHLDEDLAIVAKPAGLLVVPAPGRSAPTAVDAVGHQLQQRVYAVHRLDEDTTGVLVLARTTSARTAMEAIFRRHAVERTYLALTSRAPSPPAGRIESLLAEAADGRVRSVHAGGERAVTHYRTLRRSPAGERLGGTLVECRLETGRRNQIRVHLSELGAPIVGDRKYGWRSGGGARVPRPLLHAESIEFEHPRTRQRLYVRVDAGEPELRR